MLEKIKSNEPVYARQKNQTLWRRSKSLPKEGV
jgi:hypothetical protein